MLTPALVAAEMSDLALEKRRWAGDRAARVWRRVGVSGEYRPTSDSISP